MPLKTLWFSFRGRIARKDFWLKGILALTLIQVGFQLLMEGIDRGLATTLGPHSSAGMAFDIVQLVLSSLVLAFVSWAMFAVTIKRCHDRDRSAWFTLITLIPIVGAVWLLVELGFLKGSEGRNRFGDSRIRESSY